MFRDLSHARDRFGTWLKDVGHTDAESVIQSLLPSLSPAVHLRLASESERIGGSRVGGVPDLPAHLPWPERPAAVDVEARAAVGGTTHAPHIRRYLSQAFPFEFFAQIDLAELAALSREPTEVAPALPTNGRLLFFYDSATGPWESGTSITRVIWDETAAADIAPATPPAAFAEMIEIERADILASPNENGISDEERLSWAPKFVHPAHPMKLEAKLQCLTPFAFEYEQSPIKPLLEEEDEDGECLLDSGYDEIVEDDYGGHILLGIPVAEQDDPRLDAAGTTAAAQELEERLGHDRAACFAELSKLALDWVLLLQIGNAELETPPGAEDDSATEGTVYFLIHKDALAARRFDETVAVYQQT